MTTTHDALTFAQAVPDGVTVLGTVRRRTEAILRPVSRYNVRADVGSLTTDQRRALFTIQAVRIKAATARIYSDR